MSANFGEAPGVAAAAAEGAQPSVARSRAGGRARQDRHRNPARRDLQRHGNDVIVVAVPAGPGSLIARLVASLREAGAEASAPRADGSLLCFAARRTHDDLRQLARSTDYDATKARQLVDAGARAQADLALLRADAEHEIYMALTAEQRRRLAEAPQPGRRR